MTQIDSTPNLLSPSQEDSRSIISRFLEACKPSPEPSSEPINPTAADQLSLLGDTPLLNSPHLCDLPISRPIATPSPAIPALMANIITTPDAGLPTTRQPCQPLKRLRAVDFFPENNTTHNPQSPPKSTPVPNSPPPTIQDLPPDDEMPANPPRPQHLPNLANHPVHHWDALGSPIEIGPSEVTLPTADITTDLNAFRTKWLGIFDEDLDWQSFSNHCETYAREARSLAQTISSTRRPKPAPRRPNRPSARPPIDNRRPTTADPIASRRIQQLYRMSKKRAARKILGDDSPNYTGSPDEAFNFFSTSFGQRECNLDALKEHLQSYVPTTETDDSLFDAPSAEELQQKLRSLSNSAPGKDRLEYRHIRLIDPKCEILARMYRFCFTSCDVPNQWKTATTILIHKKGPTDDAGNFRPIALMSCLYKILMAILAKRVTAFSIQHNLLSAQQKSARPSEGCYEHTFLLQSIVNDAKRQQKNMCLAWLDIRNAFGSIPHDAILATLTHMGFPPALTQFIKMAYTGASNEVLTSTGPTQSIPILAGVKQGCPLSAILFNLTMELILRKVSATASNNPRGPIKHHGYPLSILAYADDLVVIGKTKSDLQHLLNSLSEAADALSVTFRPEKCASLSITPRNQPRVAHNDFKVQNRSIPSLKAEDHYLYLGIPIGLIVNVSQLQSLVDELSNKIRKIEQSLLTPWQKLDAIRTFIQPCLTYALRASSPSHKSLQAYRTTLISALRKICHLPDRATTHYFFANRQSGGLGFQDPFTEADLQTTVQAVKILASSDPVVAGIARNELAQTVRFASQCEPTPELMSKYLSNSPDRRLDSLRYRTGSLWTRTRTTTKRRQVTINLRNVGAPTITTPEYTEPVSARDACRFLHNITRDKAATILRDLPDQDKLARSLQNDQYGNGSSWHFSGLNVRFKDWRFIHRARLNCCPTNSVKSRWSNTNPSCRHCNEDETLPHILCHCTQNMPAITARHDKIVSRLVNAVRSGHVTTDKTVADSGSNVRPDIVITDPANTCATIIDVCCPFDNGAEALHDAIDRKELKYEHLREFFTAQGLSCKIFGFAVGALGSWHPRNEKVLSALGMSGRYKNLFQKLCCTDIIQGSTDIYRQHLGCDDALP
ncbi:uncharacterized protein LOC114540350 [Dendronephthya gigantea]|uniref:uncharacterized protein LOC114540350 n=1 Tax=Dendronephthya gigantea TaxID=151771 RepID=UPI00106DA33A|nr:uncharacterized protein LOC114540350 [Dendronephthya gigantea]